MYFLTEQQLAKSSKVLQGTGIEEDKRDLINREIGKFRKTAEVIKNFRVNHFQS